MIWMELGGRNTVFDVLSIFLNSKLISSPMKISCSCTHSSSARAAMAPFTTRSSRPRMINQREQQSELGTVYGRV